METEVQIFWDYGKISFLSYFSLPHTAIPSIPSPFIVTFAKLRNIYNEGPYSCLTWLGLKYPICAHIPFLHCGIFRILLDILSTSNSPAS